MAVVGVVVSIVMIVMMVAMIARMSGYGRARTAATARPMVTAAGAPAGIRMEPDGSRWWDGTAWVRSDASAPAGALWSPDGEQWYDGLDWHRIGAAADRPSPAG